MGSRPQRCRLRLRIPLASSLGPRFFPRRAWPPRHRAHRARGASGPTKETQQKAKTEGPMAALMTSSLQLSAALRFPTVDNPKNVTIKNLEKSK